FGNVEVSRMFASAAEVLRMDPVLPSGFFDIPGALLPERRLMLAVLEAAVSDLKKYATASGGRGKRLYADADGWFGSAATNRPLDFENICQALGLDPSFIRVGLQRWCMARRQAPSPSRTVLHSAAFRRVSGRRHRIVSPGGGSCESPTETSSRRGRRSPEHSGRRSR